MVEVNDKQKTKEELIEELQRLRQRVAELQDSDNPRKWEARTPQKPQATPRELFDNIADPVFIFDQETQHFLDCNQAAVEHYGYTLDDLRTMTPEQLHPPSERDVVEKNISDESSTSPHCYTHFTKNGESLQVEIHTDEIDYGGRKAWISVVRDITKRKRAEAALTHERDLLRTLMDNTPDYIFFKDRESRVIRTNKTHAQLLGVADPQQAVGKTDFDFFPQEEAQRFYNEEQRIMETGGPVIAREWQVPGRDGEIRWVSESKIPFSDETGQITGLVGIARDITEHKRAEEAIHQAEQRYRAVAESAVTGIGIANREEALTFVNQAFADMLGYAQEELTGMSLSQLADPEEFAGYQELTKARQEKGVHSHYETTLRRKDGSALNILVSASPLMASDGKFEGTLAVIVDITGRKRTEEALQKAHRDLEQYAASLERQTTQLRVASEVAREATAIREVNQLLDETVNLVSDRFGFYHTGIFLIDEQNRYAVLRTASSEGGRQMLEQGHRVKVSEDDTVGYVAATGESRIAADIGRASVDVGADCVLFDDLALPDTRSQAVLPLNLRGRTIGVLDVQSTEEAAFSPDNVVALQTLSDQLAIAIENARLVERTEAQLRELSLLYGEYSAGAWAKLASPQHVSSYVYDRVDISPAGQLSVPALDSAIVRGETIAVAESEATQTVLATPLKVRDQIIGALGIQGTDGAQEWSPDEIALVEAVSEQVAMALENARLFAETQRSAQTMQALYETSRALSSTLEEESLMRAVLEAVYHTLGCEHVIISTVDRKTKTIGIRHGIWNGEFDAFPTWIQAAQFPLEHPDILADVCRTGRTEIIEGWDERFNRKIWEEFGHERLLRVFMPIKMRDRVIGVIEAGYDKQEKGQIGDEEVQMMAAFMDQAAVALENAHLLEETQRKATQLAASAEVARDATAILDVRHLLNQTVHLISEQFGFYHAGVFLLDEHDEYAILQAASSEGGHRMLERGHRLRVGEVGIVGHVASTGEPRIALDVGEDAMHFANPDLPNTRSEMGLPLLVQERVVGVLDVQSTEEAAFSEDDMAILQTMADQLATAIANARLFEQVQRRARHEQLIREITARIRTTVDVENILQTTVRELGKALGVSHGLARLGTEAELAEPPTKGQADPGAGARDRAEQARHATGS